MTNSRQKGKRGELEAAKAVSKALGISARRGQQFSGIEGEDIVTELQGVHFEVKRTERLKLYDAIEQAKDDADGDIPVVLHRKSRKDWVAIVPLNDLKGLCERILGTDSPLRSGENDSDS